ncbi:MAG: LVIVD repeat-containing protein [Myxococcota bacterium]
MILLLACAHDLPADKRDPAPADDTAAPDTDSGEPTGGDDTGEPAPLELEGVWHSYYPQEEGAGSNAWRFGADGTVTWGGQPATLALTDGGLPVELSAQLTGTRGDCDWTYDYVAVMDTMPADGDLGGNYVNDYVSSCGDSFRQEGRLELTRVDRFDQAEASGLTFLGGSTPLRDGQIAVNVRVAGGHAYVARYFDGLRIYDVTDPASIVEVGHLAPAVAELWNDVKIVEADGRRYALMAGSSDGVTVVDVTDPVAPSAVARIAAGSEVHTLAVDGTYAYLATIPRRDEAVAGVVIADVSDPAAPLEVGAWDVTEVGGSFVHDLYVAGGVAYLCAWDAGLVLVDVGDPASPATLGVADYGDDMTSHSVWVTDAPGRLVAIEGGEDWGAHLRVIDVDPQSATYLEVLGELALRDEVSIHNVMMGEGATAVVSWYQDGVRLVDVSEPSAPALVGWANTWDPADPANGRQFFEGAVGVDVADGLVYVADAGRDLLVYAVD